MVLLPGLQRVLSRLGGGVFTTWFLCAQFAGIMEAYVAHSEDPNEAKILQAVVAKLEEGERSRTFSPSYRCLYGCPKNTPKRGSRCSLLSHLPARILGWPPSLVPGLTELARSPAVVSALAVQSGPGVASDPCSGSESCPGWATWTSHIATTRAKLLLGDLQLVLVLKRNADAVVEQEPPAGSIRCTEHAGLGAT